MKRRDEIEQIPFEEVQSVAQDACAKIENTFKNLPSDISSSKSRGTFDFNEAITSKLTQSLTSTKSTKKIQKGIYEAIIFLGVLKEIQYPGKTHNSSKQSIDLLIDNLKEDLTKIGGVPTPLFTATQKTPSTTWLREIPPPSKISITPPEGKTTKWTPPKT